MENHKAIKGCTLLCYCLLCYEQANSPPPSPLQRGSSPGRHSRERDVTSPVALAILQPQALPLSWRPIALSLLSLAPPMHRESFHSFSRKPPHLFGLMSNRAQTGHSRLLSMLYACSIVQQCRAILRANHAPNIVAALAVETEEGDRLERARVGVQTGPAIRTAQDSSG